MVVDTKHKGFKQFLKNIMPLPDETWEAIKSCLSYKYIKKETVYSRRGQTLTNLQFVISGMIRAYFIEDGEEITWSIFDPGEVAVDFPSFIKGEYSKLNYQAMTDTCCISISKNDLDRLYKIHPTTNYIGRILTERGFIKQHERNRSLLLDPPEKRYADLVDEKPQIILNVSQRHIASYIGVKPESLSRIKKRLYKNKS